MRRQALPPEPQSSVPCEQRGNGERAAEVEGLRHVEEALRHKLVEQQAAEDRGHHQRLVVARDSQTHDVQQLGHEPSLARHAPQHALQQNAQHRHPHVRRRAEALASARREQVGRLGHARAVRQPVLRLLRQEVVEPIHLT